MASRFPKAMPDFHISAELVIHDEHYEAVRGKRDAIEDAGGKFVPDETISTVLFDPQESLSIQNYKKRLTKLIELVGSEAIDSCCLHFTEGIHITRNQRNQLVKNLDTCLLDSDLKVSSIKGRQMLNIPDGEGGILKDTDYIPLSEDDREFLGDGEPVVRYILRDGRSKEMHINFEKHAEKTFDIIGQTFSDDANINDALMNIFIARRIAMDALAKLPPTKEEERSL